MVRGRFTREVVDIWKESGSVLGTVVFYQYNSQGKTTNIWTMSIPSSDPGTCVVLSNREENNHRKTRPSCACANQREGIKNRAVKGGFEFLSRKMVMVGPIPCHSLPHVRRGGFGRRRGRNNVQAWDGSPNKVDPP